MSIDAKTTTDKLTEPFPPQAIKTRQGGGSKRLSYVEGHTVIHRLIAATGNQFDLRVLSVDQKGDLMTALVELTIPGLGSRQHMGVQKIAPNAGEDLVKGAITDAMKKAATLFGVGLELYGPDYGSDEDAAPPQDASQRAPARPMTTDAWGKVIDTAWEMAEDSKPLADIRDYLNANRHGMTKEQRQEVVKALAKIEAEHYTAASVAG